MEGTLDLSKFEKMLQEATPKSSGDTVIWQQDTIGRNFMSKLEPEHFKNVSLENLMRAFLRSGDYFDELDIDDTRLMMCIGERIRNAQRIKKKRLL